MVNASENDLRRLAAVPLIGGAWMRALVEFAVLTVLISIAFADGLASMTTIWLTSSAYHHGIVATPIALWLILRQRDWRNAEPRRDWRGGAVIALAALLCAVGRSASLSIVEHVAFALSIIGAVIFAFGCALSMRWRFALAFLFFMVPFGEEANPVLQNAAAAVVTAMLNASGLETARDGLILSTAIGRFEIAPSCSGLRFLLASAMISTVLVSLAFRTIRARASFIAAALVAALLANWLRAYAIIALATLSERRFGVGPEHVALGWTFYGALMLGLILFARRFAAVGKPLRDGGAD